MPVKWVSVLMPSVRPSGLADRTLAICAAPPPPGEFWTTIVWPIAGSSDSARVRIKMSDVPPGLVCITTSTGPVGQES